MPINEILLKRINVRAKAMVLRRQQLHAATIGGVQVPGRRPPAWRNETAYCLAHRMPGKGPVKPLESLDGLSREELADLCSAALGTLYMALGRLSAEKSLLRLLVQPEASYLAEKAHESFSAYIADEKAQNKKNAKRPKSSRKAKK